MRRAVVGAAVLLPLLAGCLGAPGPAQGPASSHAGVVDPSGDAPPFLDALAGRFVEEPHALTVELTLASFDEATLPETLAPMGSSAWIFLCWRQGDAAPPPWVRAAASVDKVVAPDTECAGVEMFVDETLHVIGQFISYHAASDGCNAAWFCAWRLPHEIVGGAPATLRVSIPRELLYDATPGATLAKPRLETGIWPWTPSSLSERSGRYAYGCASLGATSRCLGTGEAGSRNRILDTSEEGPDYALAMATVPRYQAPASGPLIVDAPRVQHASEPLLAASAESDVLHVDLEESGTHLAYLVRVASLGPRPWHALTMQLGVADALYAASYEVVAGELSRVEGTACFGDWECHPLPFTVGFEPGTPGTIRVAFACADLARAAAGDRVNWAELWVRGSEAYRGAGAGTPLGPAWAEAGAGDALLDPVFPGEPYWLRRGC